MLLILLPSIPLLGAFALLAVGDKDVNMPFIASSITLSLAGWGLRGVFRGEQLTCTLPFSGPYSPTFQADIPVSYTHLDVYKRQELTWEPSEPSPRED